MPRTGGADRRSLTPCKVLQAGHQNGNRFVELEAEGLFPGVSSLAWGLVGPTAIPEGHNDTSEKGETAAMVWDAVQSSACCGFRIPLAGIGGRAGQEIRSAM